MVANSGAGLVGRTTEREMLDQLLTNVGGGQSAVLVIRGEPGFGKTALLEYARERASGFRVEQIAGVEAERELPFAGVHQLCARMLSRRDALPAPQCDALSVALGISSGDVPDRFLVALAVLSLLSAVAEERPLVCLVDDTQWLDEASSQVLGFVARRLLADSVALVFVVREPREHHELDGLPELWLGGLPPEDACTLLAQALPGLLDDHVRDRIVAETQGNPLALLELSRGMSAADMAGGFALPDLRDLASQIEDGYVRRVRALPEPTQRMLLLASADPVGDATLLWRAAGSLGIDADAAKPATTEHLLEIAACVRFRHPLVRSAVYRAAATPDRQAMHAALADATDAATDPDRRAWHRAHAATAPDESVARELIACASGAEARGGMAAAAAFLERAAALTPDPAERASRTLAAARSKFDTGAFVAVESLLASAEAGPLDDLDRAKVQLTRAQMSFDQQRGRDAPRLLMEAAQRLEPLDAEVACEAHLEALVAAIYAGRLAPGTDVADVATAARSAPLRSEPLSARDLMLQGLALRLTHGSPIAAPTLTKALGAYLAEERRLDRMCLAYNVAAEELWDDEAWFELSSCQAELARTTGALLLLPYALDYLAGVQIQRGDLSAAGELLAEAEGLELGVRPEFPLRLAAFRGQPAIALPLVEVMNRGALERGEGIGIAAVAYAEAVLYNGLGQYELAFEAARKATAHDDIVVSSWTLYELVEAATRTGQTDVAKGAADDLSERTAGLSSAWATGAALRSRALVADGAAAEELHRQTIDCLKPSRMAWYLARARLSYGEWLRRANRRVDSREQLRSAYEMFTAMGGEAFADRARRELLATGETVRKRQAETRDQLTPQEEQIARLAGEGLSNPEIGARLFLSPRTVEWHLHKVYGKLGLRSRRELGGSLPSPPVSSAA